MPNVKLLPGFLDSDFWQSDARTRVVWLTMMFMADEDGVVRAGLLSLARRCGLETQECVDAISRLQGEYGLVGKEGDGWKMVNHGRMAAIQTRRQEANAASAARYRAKKAKG